MFLFKVVHIALPNITHDLNELQFNIINSSALSWRRIDSIRNQTLLTTFNIQCDSIQIPRLKTFKLQLRGDTTH